MSVHESNSASREEGLPGKWRQVFVSVVVRRLEQILLVQEEKPDAYGQWNIPGGRIDAGEFPAAGAVRETREETGLTVVLDSFLGVYCYRNWMRFVYEAASPVQEPIAGDEILAVRWVSLEEVATFDDAELHNAPALRTMFRDLAAGKRLPLDSVSHL